MSFQQDPMEVQARFSGILENSQADPRYQQQPFATLPPQSYIPASTLAPQARTAQQNGRPSQQATFVDPGAAYYTQPPSYQYGSVEDATAATQQARWYSVTRLDLASMLPAGFTFCLFCIFITPLGLLLHVGLDPHVEQWVGRYYPWFFFFPAMLLLVHVVHAQQKAPNKIAVIFSLVLPCILILVLGDRLLLQSYELANRFAARDCSTFPLKQAMERDYQSAKKFYAECMAEKSSTDKTPFASATALYRIQDCGGYQDLLVAHPSLPYLRQTEEYLSCAGWCTPDQPLWLFGEVKDSCSSAVAEVFFGKIQREVLQAVSYTIVVLGLSSIGLISVGPSLRKAGLEW